MIRDIVLLSHSDGTSSCSAVVFDSGPQQGDIIADFENEGLAWTYLQEEFPDATIRIGVV